MHRWWWTPLGKHFFINSTGCSNTGSRLCPIHPTHTFYSSKALLGVCLMFGLIRVSPLGKVSVTKLGGRYFFCALLEEYCMIMSWARELSGAGRGAVESTVAVCRSGSGSGSGGLPGNNNCVTVLANRNGINLANTSSRVTTLSLRVIDGADAPTNCFLMFPRKRAHDNSNSNQPARYSD